MKRKLLSGLTALVLLFGLTALPVAAEGDAGEDTEPVYVAQVGDNKYTSVQAAVTAIAESESTTGTVTVVANSKEDVNIPENATITLEIPAGITLTNESGHTITNNGTLTITGAGTVDNVTHGKGALYNNVGGTATLQGCTFTRSLENGQNSANNGGNSWYAIKNFGTMNIYDGVKVIQNGHYSSLLASGWQNYSSAASDKGSSEPKPTTEAVLNIYGGYFSGGLNTIKNDDYAKLTIEGGTFTNITQYAVMNWNEATISGGSFDTSAGDLAVIFCGYSDDTYNKGVLTITGGMFKSAEGKDCFEASGNITVNVSGGLFSSPVPAAYCAEGYNPTGVYIDGYYTVCDHYGAVAVAAKAATCVDDGNIAYWYCEACGRYFSDAEYKKEITLADTVIPATGEHTSDGGVVTTEATTGHDGVRTYSCTVCGTVLKTETIPQINEHPEIAAAIADGTWGKAEATPAPTAKPAEAAAKPTTTTIPQTGDASNPALPAVVMIAALLGLCGTALARRRGSR